MEFPEHEAQLSIAVQLYLSGVAAWYPWQPYSGIPYLLMKVRAS